MEPLEHMISSSGILTILYKCIVLLAADTLPIFILRLLASILPALPPAESDQHLATAIQELGDFLQPQKTGDSPSVFFFSSCSLSLSPSLSLSLSPSLSLSLSPSLSLSLSPSLSLSLSLSLSPSRPLSLFLFPSPGCHPPGGRPHSYWEAPSGVGC